MLARIFLGLIIIIAFLIIYPSFISLWTDNVSGFNLLINATSASDLEKSIWGLFPLVFLVMGIGGVAWLIVRDREK